MKRLTPIFTTIQMFYCSCPVPPINDNKDGDFQFSETQILNYGQSQTHPSIVFIPGGWNGHEYWLATTPYPKATGVFENPCIFYGDADENGNPPRIFYPISGTVNDIYTVINNPVVKVPNNSTTNSDPDLFFDSSTNLLWLISRENSNSYAVYSQKSLDGQSWTPRNNRDTGFLWKKGVSDLINKPEFLSPALLKVGEKLRVYCLSGSSGIYSKDYITNKGICWGLWVMEGTTLEGSGDFQYVKKASILGKRDIEPWHMDIFTDARTGYFYMICSARNFNDGGSNACYLAESKDGWNFYMFSRPLLAGVPHYRPTAFIRPTDNKLVVYWCSEGGAPSSASSYPRGESDITIDGRAIGLSYMNFDEVLSTLKNDNVFGWY